MASRTLSLDEVLALLDPEEVEDGQEPLDDPCEVLLEGSDEEFDGLAEVEDQADGSDGTNKAVKNKNSHYIAQSLCVGRTRTMKWNHQHLPHFL